MKTWKNGRLEPCTREEFAAGLRRLAEWAEKEFAHRSDAAGHIGERLSAAADVIDGEIACKEK